MMTDDAHRTGTRIGHGPRSAAVIAALLSLSLLGSAALGAEKEKPTAAELLNIDWVHPPDDPPSRVQHRTFHSECMDTEVGYNVYLPPGYEEAEDRRYPVLYFLHGSRGHESQHIYLAKHLHRAIRTDKVPPMLMVFVNGGHRSGYIDSVDGTVLHADHRLAPRLAP